MLIYFFVENQGKTFVKLKGFFYIVVYISLLPFYTKKVDICWPLPYSLPSGSSANPTARHGVPSFCHQTRKKSPSTLIFPSGSSDSPTPTSVRSARVWWMGGWWWWWAYFWIMFWQISKLFGSYFIMFGHWFWN